MRGGWIKCGLAGLLLALTAFVAFAGGPKAVRRQVETSMLVTGTIDIAIDGSVAGYALDQPEALPESVVALAAQALPQWRFKPIVVDGKPVRGRAKMTLRYVVRKQGDDKYLMRITSATFGDNAKLAAQTQPSPVFPMAAMRAGITGTVFVLLRVGRDGKVGEAAVERVNLRVVGSDRQMQQGRRMLARASLVALRAWTFSVPKSGKAADEPYWTVRVPVAYLMQGQQPVAYGDWDTYVPGPYHRAPWILPDDYKGSDALVAGGIYPVGSGPELLTRLDAG